MGVQPPRRWSFAIRKAMLGLIVLHQMVEDRKTDKS